MRAVLPSLLHSSNAFGLGAGCKPVPRGDDGPPLFKDESSFDETVAGKPVFSWHLTLAVSKWSQMKPRSVKGQTRGPQGCTQEAGVQPWLSWGPIKALSLLQGAELYLALLLQGCCSMPCRGTNSIYVKSNCPQEAISTGNQCPCV